MYRFIRVLGICNWIQPSLSKGLLAIADGHFLHLFCQLFVLNHLLFYAVGEHSTVATTLSVGPGLHLNFPILEDASLAAQGKTIHLEEH